MYVYLVRKKCGMGNLTVKPITREIITFKGNKPDDDNTENKTSLLDKDGEPDTFETSEVPKPENSKETKKNEKPKATASGTLKAGLTAAGISGVTYKTALAAGDGLIENTTNAIGNVIDNIGVRDLITEVKAKGGIQVKVPKFLKGTFSNIKNLTSCKSFAKTLKGSVKYVGAAAAALVTGISAFKNADKTEKADLKEVISDLPVKADSAA